MIREQSGDLLEIEYDGKFYYLVVPTNIVLFGGNIVFAHHTDATVDSRIGTRYLPGGTASISVPTY